MQFPPGFLWGAATASYQIEGSTEADGRGRSIWDVFSHTPGRTHHGDTGDVAADHYRRVEQDLDWMSGLGLTAYRFSIAWPRVQPDGPANARGVDFYRRLVDGLRRRRIVPAATLYHWDLPETLQETGGWVARDTGERFAEYAAIVAAALGDAVGLWITLNEPWCSAWLGHGTGVHAPGHTDVGEAVAATHHLLLGHGRAVRALRAELRAPQVGVTLNLVPVRAAGTTPADQDAVRRVDGNHNRLFLDPILRGRYPDDVLEQYGDVRPGFTVQRKGDLEAIAAPLDFLGVNYYQPRWVVARDGAAAGASTVAPDRSPILADLGAEPVLPDGAALTAMGWTVEPDGLTELLVRVRDDYPPIPIHITENGIAVDDYVTPDGAVHDVERIAYLEGHLRAVQAALEAGVDVRGYFTWTLLDNFEWARGYSKRFGLLFVDYGTQRRLPKDSFAWYREVIAANGLPADGGGVLEARPAGRRPAPAITGLGHVAFRIADLGRSLDFYCGALGFEDAFRLEREGQPSPWIVYLRLPDDRFLELFPGGEGEGGARGRATGYNHLCLAVEDMPAALGELAAWGVTGSGEPKRGQDGNWQAWIADPDGNPIELMQVEPDSPQGRAMRA
jgi:beta-glucosidase